MQRSLSSARTEKSLSSLSDDGLLRELHRLVAAHRRVTAALIEHLGEVDARRLHVNKGFSSLFAYCVEELRFSEDEACRRIEAARLARRFPAVVSFVETGTLSLTVLALLKPHLSESNHVELLAGVSGASVRQAKEWLAARFPQPDVPSTIRKQPERLRSLPPSELLGSAPESRSPESAPNGTGPALDTILSEPARVPSGAQSDLVLARSAPMRVPTRADFVATRGAPARARVEPLSSNGFLVKFTASRAFRDKLELVCDLMRHANPDGELSVVLERAVDMLIAELQKRKHGKSARPQTKPRPAKGAHVTRSVRREVVTRDGWRCSFVADDGRRCDAQAFLEFDHKTPKGCGGGSHSGNLRLLCRAHNRREAEQAYGRAHVARAITEAQQARGSVPEPGLQSRVSARPRCEQS